MPAVNFTVTWPDGQRCTYYSPSTVVLDFFQEGEQYSLAGFHEKSEVALMSASERVRQKFGFACSAAAAELEKITRKYHQLQTDGVSGQVMISSLGL